MTVVPVRRPIATQYEHLWINWSPIEIGYFSRMLGVCKVHNRDPTLVPGLNFYITAGNWNKRSVVRHTILAVTLCRRHLVVARETQFVILQAKHRVGAPLVWIVRTTTCAQSPSPLISEHDFAPIVGKRSRVPICIVRIVYCIETLRMNGITYIQHNSISG